MWEPQSPPDRTWLIQRSVCTLPKRPVIGIAKNDRYFEKLGHSGAILSFAGFKGEPQLGLLQQPLIPVR